VALLEVQPVIQLVRAASYGPWKAQRERAWQRDECTTAGWPKKLDDAEIAALLLPISAGRVGAAVGTHPICIAEPIFSKGRPGSGGQDEIVLGLLTNWCRNPSAGVTGLLAPPVVERIGQRGVLDRRVEDFGLTWHLPRADGI